MATQKRNQKSQRKPRGKNGDVTVGRNAGYLRLTIPKKYSPLGKQKHIPLGLKDTIQGNAEAEKLAATINSLIIQRVFDFYRLEEYVEKILGNRNTESLVPDLANKEPELDELWEEYVEHKRACRRKETTIAAYDNIKKAIHNLSTKKVSDAKIICIELSQRTTSKQYDNFLDHINACCDLALERKRISENPFKRIRKETQRPNRETEPDPFSLWELERIISAYEEHPIYFYIAPFIKFRAKTAARPGEAMGLRWKNVDLEKGEIYFCESITFIQNKHCYTVGTKNGVATEDGRYFPICNPELKALLEELRPPNPDPDGFVFQAPGGGHIKYPQLSLSWHGNKLKRLLKNGEIKEYRSGGIVYKLSTTPIEEGGIEKYRPHYNIRHTFITEAIQQMGDGRTLNFDGISQLAKWVGNSPDTIIKRYLGRNKNTDILNIDARTSNRLRLGVEGAAATDNSGELEPQLMALNQEHEVLTKHVEKTLSDQPLMVTSTPVTNTIAMPTSPARNSEPTKLKNSSQTQPSKTDIVQLTLFSALAESVTQQ